MTIGGRMRLIPLSLVLTLVSCMTAEPEPAASIDSAQPGAYRIYVTNEDSGDISIIDSVTHEVVSTVPVGKRPRGIHASPDGQTIYVALSGSPKAPPGIDESTLPPADKTADGIGVFDVRGAELVKVIEGGSDPEEFDLSIDGKFLYTSNEDVGAASIVDIASGAVLATLQVGDKYSEPEGVATSPDGKFVYVTTENNGEIAVIDTAAKTLSKVFRVGLRPRDVAFMPDGTKAYVTNENDGTLGIIDTTKHEQIGAIELGPAGEIKPMAVVLSPDATSAYVSTGRGRKVFMIDTATEMITGSVEAGERPWGIGISPDGKTVYTANGPSGDVSVIDLDSRTVMKRIPVGQSPWGILVLQH